MTYVHKSNRVAVQQLLSKDFTDRFEKPLWYNKNWIAIHGPLVKKSVRRAKKKAIYRVFGLYDSTLKNGKHGPGIGIGSWPVPVYGTVQLYGSSVTYQFTAAVRYIRFRFFCLN